MNRQEFLNELSECLENRVNSGEIEDTIRFYRDYFTEEMNKGKTEEEVAASLGSPRLIAHSIVDAHEDAENGEPAKEFYDAGDNSYGNYENYEEYSKMTTLSPAKVWAIKIGVIVVLIALLIVVFMVLRFLFPIILIAVIAGWIYRSLFGRS